VCALVKRLLPGRRIERESPASMQALRAVLERRQPAG
jgi:hypothetical protein